MFDLAQCHVVFQPIVNIKTLEIEYHEALLRHKRFENIQHFIELAEENQFICDIDLFVFDQCLKRISDGHNRSIAINLSIRTLETFGFRVAQKLSQYPLAKFVIIEVTESREFYDHEKICRFINLIKMSNARVAVDDYDDGYSNKNRVRSFKPDILKISVRKPKPILLEAIQLANELGAAIVFEKVECERELEVCKKIGASHGQGYLFGKPM